MSIFEVIGGPITHKYLMRKTKQELAFMHLHWIKHGLSPEEANEIRSEVDRLRARVAELEAAQSWRPIEACPRDGSFFIAARFHPRDDEPDFCSIAHWFVWANPAGVYRRYADEHEMPIQATHWMPLPPPPQKEQGNG